MVGNVTLTHAPRRRNWRRIAERSAKRVLIIAIILVSLAPGYWVIEASLQAQNSFFGSPLIPSSITLDNYVALVRQTDFLLWVRNSLIVCLSGAAIATGIAALAAFAFSRLRFTGRRHGLMAMLVVQMFPVSVALPAYYYILLHLGLLNTFAGLVLVLAGGSTAFITWVFKGYLDNIPHELEEAAYVDGATEFQALRRILLPLARPMLAVAFLLSFIGLYSEYILSSLILSSTDLYTLPLGLRGFIYNEFALHWTQFAAAALVGSVPLLVIFLFMQRYLVSGLTRGALRG
jgi:arabinogalactan oligomer/maltooligosaccharide transport system permease protein